MDGRCAPNIFRTKRTSAHARNNKCDSRKIPHRIRGRKKQCNENRPKQKQPWIHPRGHEPEVHGQIQIPRVHTKQQKHPWRPHQAPQRESRKRIPNPTSHSREQELQQHWNANNMGTNTKLHSINHSIQQRNLESRKNRTGKNQQDHGQHHKKNTNGTTEYPQGKRCTLKPGCWIQKQ